MSQDPGTRIIEERNHGKRTIDGVEVYVIELVWNDTDGRSWDVYVASNDECLTEESFDNEPTDDDIRGLFDNLDIQPPSTFWWCRGCGAVYSENDPDFIVDHVQGCDRVDGAGNPL